MHILAASVLESSVPEAWRPRRSSAPNALSVVLRVEYGDFQAILTGDATTATEYKILQWYEDDFLDVEVLKIGHHGSSATSTHSDWATVTSPRTAVASAGRFNQYGHPMDLVIRRLEAFADDDDPHDMAWAYYQNDRRRWRVREDYTKSIYTTSASGTVRVYADGDRWWVEE